MTSHPVGDLFLQKIMNSKYQTIWTCVNGLGRGQSVVLRLKNQTERPKIISSIYNYLRRYSATLGDIVVRNIDDDHIAIFRYPDKTEAVEV